MNRLSMLTMMSICTKMKTNRVCYQPLTTPQVVLILIIALHLCDLNNNMKPNPLRTAEPDKELTKPKKNNKYFWCFRFFQTSKQSKNKPNKAKSFWIFLKANQNKETNQEKQQKYFGIFVFLRNQKQKPKRRRNNGCTKN